MKRKIKIAVVGVGNISESHIDAYRHNEDAELYAFCDINEKRLQEKGKKYGVTRLYTDCEKMFAALPEIDAVSVCTYNSAHKDVTIAALRAGKDVLCEKPMALNAAEAEEMQRVAKECGRKLMIGFVRRYGNDCAIVRDFIAKGYLGDIYYAKARYVRRDGCPGGWFADKRYSGGGPLIDLGVHVIDLVRYLMGNAKPVSVYGATFAKLKECSARSKKNRAYKAASIADGAFENNVEDLATALIRFDNGAVLGVETSFALHTEKDENEISLFGTAGSAKLDPDFHLYTQLLDYPADVGLAMETALTFEGLFRNEIDAFVRVVRGEETCLSPAEDGVAMMRILDAVYESARTGHEILLA